MNPDDITYHDFVIRFERRWRGRYPISIESPVANIQTDVRLPFVPEQIQTLQGQSEYLESDEERVGKDLGVNLFDALFADCRALRLFERNLGIVGPVSSKR